MDALTSGSRYEFDERLHCMIPGSGERRVDDVADDKGRTVRDRLAELKGTDQDAWADVVQLINRAASSAAPWPNDELAVANADSLHELIDQLRIIRRCFDLSLDDVANRMNVDKSVVSRIESGTTNPTVRTLRRYAAAIGAYIAPIAVPKQEMEEWQRYIRSVTDALEVNPFISAPSPVKRRDQNRIASATSWRDPGPIHGVDAQGAGAR